MTAPALNGTTRTMSLIQQRFEVPPTTIPLTEVCPEHIHITDNAIIRLKERVADRNWDPLRRSSRPG